VILLLLALYFLPQQDPVEASRVSRLRTCPGPDGWHRGRDPGLGRADPALRVHCTLLHRQQRPGWGGANVVNVILVDFRGFDTLGEITVLAVAALGIYALLDGLRLAGPRQDAAERPWDWDLHPVIMASLTRLLLPLALLVSVFILLRATTCPAAASSPG